MPLPRLSEYSMWASSLPARPETPYQTPYSPPPGPQQDIGSLLQALASPGTDIQKLLASGGPAPAVEPPQPAPYQTPHYPPGPQKTMGGLLEAVASPVTDLQKLVAPGGIDPGLLGGILGDPMGSQQAIAQSAGGALSERAFTPPPQAEPQAGLQAAPPQEPVGQLSDIQGPGDLDLAGQRAASEKKLAQLTALRDISEGLGTYIPVKGDIVFGREGRGVEATGIREAMGREEFNLAEMSAQDKLRLKAELAQETDAAAIAAQAAAAGPPAGKPLPTTTLKEFRGAETAIRGLEEVLKEKKDKSFDTGPIANAWETVLTALGGDWERLADKTAFKNKAARVAREYIFSLSGKQTSGPERKALLKLIPKGSQNDRLFEKNLRDFVSFIREKQSVILETAPESTPELEKLRGMMEEGEMVTVSVGGQRGEIPANQEAAFRAKYGG